MSAGRQIERALRNALRARGYQVTDDGGDLYVVLRRHCALAMAGAPCAGRGEARISLTEVAAEIESKMGVAR